MLNVSELVARITGKQAERRQARDGDFAALVRTIADAKEPKPDLIEQTLLFANKSPQDLAAAVELLLARRRLRVNLDQARHVPDERAKIDKQAEAANKKLAQAEEEHARALAPLQGRTAELDALAADADTARAELRRTAPAALFAEMTASQGRGLAASARQATARARERVELDAAAEWRRRAQQEAEARWSHNRLRGPSPGLAGETPPAAPEPPEAAHRRAQAKKHAAEAEAAERQVRAELAEQDRILARMMEP